MSKLQKYEMTSLRDFTEQNKHNNIELECKSCGSVKFKQIKLYTYQCEYCGRTIITNNDNSLLKYKPFKSLICAGYVIMDPTRCLQLKIE